MDWAGVVDFLNSRLHRHSITFNDLKELSKSLDVIDPVKSQQQQQQKTLEESLTLILNNYYYYKSPGSNEIAIESLINEFLKVKKFSRLGMELKAQFLSFARRKRINGSVENGAAAPTATRTESNDRSTPKNVPRSPKPPIRRKMSAEMSPTKFDKGNVEQLFEKVLDQQKSISKMSKLLLGALNAIEKIENNSKKEGIDNVDELSSFSSSGISKSKDDSINKDGVEHILNGILTRKGLDDINEDTLKQINSKLNNLKEGPIHQNTLELAKFSDLIQEMKLNGDKRFQNILSIMEEKIQNMNQQVQKLKEGEYHATKGSDSQKNVHQELKLLRQDYDVKLEHSLNEINKNLEFKFNSYLKNEIKNIIDESIAKITVRNKKDVEKILHENLDMAVKPQMDLMAQEIDGIIKNNDSVRNSISDLKNNAFSSLESQIKTLKSNSKIDNVESELEKLKSSINVIEKSNLKFENSQKKQLENVDLEIKLLKSNCVGFDKIDKKIENLDSQLKSFKSNEAFEKSTSKLNNLDNQMKNLKSNMENLEKSNKKFDNYENDIKLFKSNCSSLEKSLKKMEDMELEVKNIKSNCQAFEKLKGQIENLESQIKNMKSNCQSVEAVKTKVENIEKQINNLKTNHETLQKSNKTLETETVEKFKQKFNGLENDIKTINTYYQNIEKTCKKLETDVKLVGQTANKSNLKFDDLSEEIKSLSSNDGKSITKIEKIENEIIMKFEKMENDVKTMDKSNRTFENQINNLEASNKKFEKIDGDIKMLEKSNSNIENNIKILNKSQKTLDNLENQIKNLEASNKKFEKIDGDIKILQNSNKKLEQIIESNTKTLDNSNIKSENLVNKLETDVNSLSTTVNNSKVKISALETRNCEISEKLNEIHTTNNRDSKMFEKMENKIEISNSESEQKLVKVNEELKILKSSLDCIKDSVKKFETLNTEVKVEIRSNKRNFEEKLKNMEKMENDITTLKSSQKKIDNTDKKIDSLKFDIKNDLKSQSSTIQISLDSLDKNHKQLEADLKTCQNSIQDSSNSLKEFKNSSKANQNISDEYCHKVQKMESEIQLAQKTIKELSEAFEKYQIDMKAIQNSSKSQLNSLKTDLKSDFTLSVQEFNKKLEKLESENKKIKPMESEFKVNLKSNYDEFNKKCLNLESEFKKFKTPLELELKKLKTKLCDLTSLKEDLTKDLKSNNESVEQKLCQSKTELNEFKTLEKSKFTLLDKKVKEFNENFTNLKSEVYKNDETFKDISLNVSVLNKCISGLESKIKEFEKSGIANSRNKKEPSPNLIKSELDCVRNYAEKCKLTQDKKMAEIEEKFSNNFKIQRKTIEEMGKNFRVELDGLSSGSRNDSMKCKELSELLSKTLAVVDSKFTQVMENLQMNQTSLCELKSVMDEEDGARAI